MKFVSNESNRFRLASAVAAILLCFFLFACEKDQPSCTGNCLNVVLRGSTRLITSGAPLANVPIEVKWLKGGLCMGCTSYRVVAGKTREDGTFSFNVTIDTSFFRDYHLSIRVPEDSNYVILPAGSIFDREVTFYDLDVPAMGNIAFTYFPKTDLTIKLNRVLNDNFDRFSVAHNFVSNFGYGYYSINGSPFAKDTILHVKTSADTYTRIIWTKTVSVDRIEQIDSLFCTASGPNIFTIDY